MTPACRQLFEHALRYVTPKDVSDLCPADPGNADYVREFTAILSMGTPPATSNFDINETVGLTWWADASSESDPIRFRRFRMFTNAVGVAICTGPEGPNECMPPNYFGISLLDDAQALQDSQMLRLLFPAFGELHQRITDCEGLVEEAPFFLLGQLILAFMGFAPSADTAHLCERLISEESRQTGRASPDFLWGCTFFGQMHEQWKRFVERSFPLNADDDSVRSLRNALLSPPTNAG